MRSTRTRGASRRVARRRDAGRRTHTHASGVADVRSESIRFQSVESENPLDVHRTTPVARTHRGARTHAYTYAHTFARARPVCRRCVAILVSRNSRETRRLVARPATARDASRVAPRRAASCRVLAIYFHARQRHGVTCRTIAAAATAASPANRSTPHCVARCILSMKACTGYSTSIRSTARGCSSSSFSPSPACCWPPACWPQGATTLRRKSLDRNRNRTISTAFDDYSMTRDKDIPPVVSDWDMRRLTRESCEL